ncbi:MAG: polysaccharide deacetylase family protein [Bacteroidales bacterium]|jgi:peptidoglycan/xylan/chitin deacetylase (PgdA/CDA1 family)|nr:polysaccharide deacetylase family protein [Bacteroidales bacterium]MDD4002329.1 polysaccharide deacetylase family protein [Bacteroidales bacterium]MDD4528468.1 polysaccharide deacetylase family protein [Bacteroidales bacterium]MDD4829539.1 polysaccharide deacetylase family protein [Bacteroidales bacterium]
MLTKVHPILQFSFFKQCEFKINSLGKNIYLTFDDGPVPEVTPEVLDLLDEYNAKATFFCVGENLQKYPEILNEIIKRGHKVGNHTFHHIKGWNTKKDEDYYADIEKTNQLINSNLFRPPYGRITPKQHFHLKKKYRIIFWSVISYDYNRLLTKRRVWRNVRNSITNNDIVLFHDSIKAKENMLYALKNTLFFFTAKGYKFKSI